MPEINLMKQAGALIPSDSMTVKYLESIKVGDVIHANFKKMRSPQFHRKYFALLNFAFEHMEQCDHRYNGEIVEPNFDEFRNNLCILAGHYTKVFDLSGVIHFRAKSISFAKMDETEFSDLYDKTITVILRKVLNNYSRKDLDDVINNLMSFA